MAVQWTHPYLDQQRLIGDPLADQAIDQLVEVQGPEESRRLFDRLIRNVDLPLDTVSGPLRDYLEATHALPATTDWAMVRQAHELFVDHGPKFLLFLYYKSLPLLYLNAHGALVLEQTSRLTNSSGDLRIFARRVAETGQFLLDVMAPGNLQPGAKGIQAIQKVRLIHASVRHFMPADRWDIAKHGVPINQEDLAQTLMTFCITPIDALAQFGLTEKSELLDSYLHTWNAIGELLGIQKALLPDDLAAARRLLDIILERQERDSPAGQLLTQALIDFAKQNLPTDFERAPELLMIHMIGAKRAAMLGISPETGCLGKLLPEFFRTYFNLGERLEDRLDTSLQVFVQQLARRTAGAMVSYFDQYKSRNFSIPQPLEQVWQIEDGLQPDE